MTGDHLCSQCGEHVPLGSMKCPCGASLARPTPSETDMRIRPVSLPRSGSPRRSHQSQHYFARYWRGELSLVHSFWISNCLVDVLLAIAQQQLLVAQETSPSPLFIHQLYTALLYIQMFILGPWQIVGLWRAARRYLQDTGWRVWGRCAQGIVVLGTLATLVTVPYWVPLYLEMAQIATNAGLYRYAVTLSEDGKVVQVDGGIGLGLAQRLVRELSQHPGVEVIGLNSPGGLLAEAAKVQSFIEERGLSTYVVGHCQSACTSIFLAGSHRLLHKDAQMGFHRGSVPGLPDVAARDENDRNRHYMLSHGVAAPFVDKALGTPAYEMWFPTSEELVQAGVVTDLVERLEALPPPRFLTTARVSDSRSVTASGSSSQRLVAFPNTSGGLMVDLPGFRIETDEIKPDGRRYLKATHPQTNLIISVTLERRSTAATYQGCLAHLGQLKITPLVARGYDRTYDTSGAWPRLAYTIREHQGVRVEQRNIRTCFAQGNIYADVHLSKVSYQSVDASLFEALFNTIHMVDAPVRQVSH
jgi:hypothetical protein